MEKLMATFVRLANEKSDPNTPLLSPSQIASIEKKFLLAFPVFHTPTHPTYSVMIESAIKGLNKEEGSSEESISDYIKENFDGLPWAHDEYLKHHLSKLCENGEIVLNSTTKCYNTPARSMLKGCSSVKKHSYRKFKLKTKECMIDQDDNREGNSSEENVVQVSENLTGFQEEDVMTIGNRKIKRRRRRLVFEDDDDDQVVGGNGNSISSKEDLVEGNGDDLIEEWDCIRTRIENDVSSVKELHLNLNNSKNDHEFGVNEVGLRERELMIVPYVGSNGGMNQTMEQRYPLIVCGLTELPKQVRMSKNVMKKKFKVLNVKKKLCSESKSDFVALSEGGNLVEHDQEPELLSRRQPETKVSGMENGVTPWLMPMLKGLYFIPCAVHANLTRSECNMFCLDCMDDPFCSHCFVHHDQNHRVVQIRKASYRNAVRVCEIEKHIDISHIQTYIINSAKIVFLNPRVEPKPPKGHTRACEICLQCLIDDCRFCSLWCKFSGPMQESPKFKELETNHSQRACSLENGLIGQLERPKQLDPPCLSSLEDEDNLPLHKVLKKFNKQKKHVVYNPSENTLELTSTEKEEKQCPELGTNSIVGERGSMLGSIAEIRALDFETDYDDDDGDDDDDEEPPGYEGPPGFEQGRSQRHLEVSKEDLAPSSNKKLEQIQEGLCKPVNSQNLKNKNKDMKSNGRKRPRKNKGAIKLVKRGVRGRPRKHIEASKEDRAKFLNMQAQEGASKPVIDHEGPLKNPEATKEVDPLEGSSELTISQNSQLKKENRGRPRKQLTSSEKNQQKRGRGRPRKIIEPSKEDSKSLAFIDPLQQSQDTKEKEEDRERLFKQKEGTKKDVMNLNLREEERQFEALNCEQSQKKNRTLKKHLQGIKQLSKNGRGRPRKQKEVNKEKSDSPMNLFHKLEVRSKQKEREVDDSPNSKPDQSENEVFNQNLSTERVTSDKGSGVEQKDNTYINGTVNEPEKSQSEVYKTLETQLETPPFGYNKQGNQFTEEQEDLQICHKSEIIEGKLQEQVEPLREKSEKVTTLHVPLSSKVQLRSRINRQLQDSI